MNKMIYGLIFLLCMGMVSAIDVSDCGNLNVAGETYNLLNNVGSDGACLFVLANDITIDAHGFTIADTILASGFTNLTVRNAVVNMEVVISDSGASGGGLVTIYDSVIGQNVYANGGWNFDFGTSAGTIILNNCTVGNNVYANGGVGDYVATSGGTITINNSVVSGIIQANGGTAGAGQGSGGVVNIVRSAVAGVYAEGSGYCGSSSGGTINIYNPSTYGVLSVTGCTEDGSINFFDYVEPCTPDWICSEYTSCDYMGYQDCTAVTDNNVCGESYTGDYTEFSPNFCGTTITECGTLSTPDGIYLLSNDIGTGGQCLRVTANNIIINGQGYTISGTINALALSSFLQVASPLTIYNTIITEDIWSYGSTEPNPPNGKAGGTVNLYNSTVRDILAYGLTYPVGGVGGTITATDSTISIADARAGNSGYYFKCNNGVSGGAITLTNTYYKHLYTNGGISSCGGTTGPDGVQTINGGCQYDWIAYYDPTTCPSSGQWNRYYTDLGSCGLPLPIGNGQSVSCAYTPPVYANQTFNNVTTTDLNTVADIAAVAEFTVATTASAVQFVNPVDLSTVNITNIAEVVLMSSTAISIDTTTVPQLSAPAVVALTVPATTTNQCENFLLYYSPGFYTTERQIVSNGYVVATGANVGGDCNDPSICTNVECTNGVLTFTALGFSGFSIIGLTVDEATNEGLNNTKNLVFAGLALIAVLILVTIAWGVIQIFKGGTVDFLTLSVAAVGGAVVLFLAFIIIYFVFKALGG